MKYKRLIILLATLTLGGLAKENLNNAELSAITKILTVIIGV